MAEIYEMLESAAESLNGGSVYICGAPGLGKTFTINKVMKKLEFNKDKFDKKSKKKISFLRGQVGSIHTIIHFFLDFIHSFRFHSLCFYLTRVYVSPYSLL